MSSPAIHAVPSRLMRALPVFAALASGLLLALAFPPVGCWPLAFVGLIPVLLAPAPRRNASRALCGMVLGYAHFVVALWWLNEVGFGAGAFLAIVCACFPALWYFLYCHIVWAAKPPETPENTRGGVAAETDALIHRNGSGLWAFRKGWLLAVAILSLAALWVALEWVRGWIFTGFPWDFLGVSQAFAPTRMLATFAGIYGISFLAVIANLLLAAAIQTRFRLHALAVLLLGALLCTAWCLQENAICTDIETASKPSFAVLAIQGNTPESRVWDEEVLRQSWGNYALPTAEGVDTTALHGQPVDLILWPEGVMPCPLTYPPFASALLELLEKVQKPLLMGTLDGRWTPGSALDDPDAIRTYNSVFLLRQNAHVLLNPIAAREECYDKVHLVPFGEYVPFSKYLPWLVKFLGMGRDLTPGKDFTLFQMQAPLRNGDAARVRFGVNICFEDAFAGISRRFVRDGADFLFTVTNDCWFGESAGARQHLAHAVFRAIENRCVLLRSGNNSDTCLILPNGSIHDPILGEDGQRFAAGWKRYEIPLAESRSVGTTFYSRSGDLFVWACAATALLQMIWLLRRAYRRKLRLASVRGA